MPQEDVIGLHEERKKFIDETLKICKGPYKRGGIARLLEMFGIQYYRDIAFAVPAAICDGQKWAIIDYPHKTHMAQNFMCAHEIGHYLLHPSEGLPREQKEWEADYFAAMLTGHDEPLHYIRFETKSHLKKERAFMESLVLHDESPDAYHNMVMQKIASMKPMRYTDELYF